MNSSSHHLHTTFRFFLLLMGLSGSLAFCQPAQESHQDLQQMRKDFAYAQYANSLSTHQLLRNGKLYKYYYPRASGQHYLKGAPRTGWVMYHGIRFEEITLSYDLYNQLLFTAEFHQGGNRYLIIPSEQVSEFGWEKMYFIRLNISPDSSILAPGFYQLAYQKGDTQLLVKWRKKLLKYASSRAAAVTGKKPFKFTDDHAWYLVLTGTPYPIKGKKSLEAILGDKKAFKAFRKKHRIKLNPKSGTFTQELIKILEAFESTLE